MQTPRPWVDWTFFGGLVVVLGAILTTAIGVVLPEAVAGRISRNSEGLLLALALTAWIRFSRPRVVASERDRVFVILVSSGCFLVAGALLASDLPSRFRTLNETFLALGLLIPYVQLRRPLPRAVPLVASGAVLALLVTISRTPLGTDLAETWAFLALTPIALDVVDRRILDRAADPSATARRVWFTFLVATPLVLTWLQYGVGVSGAPGDVVRYGVRCTEAFVGVLLVHAYFAAAERWSVRSDGAERVDTTSVPRLA